VSNDSTRGHSDPDLDYILARYREEHTDDDELGQNAPDEANPKDTLGIKKSRLDLVPPALAIAAAPAMALGASKYGPFNWREKAVKATVYIGAMERHLAAYKDGQTIDPESGYSHLGHIAACIGILEDARAIGKLIDDRPLPGGAASLLEEQNASK